MVNRSKRKLEDFDPNKSDSDDGDYDNKPPPSASRSRTKPRSLQKRKSQTRKPAKRRRERYGDSEDDIEQDSDEISEEEDSLEENSDDDFEAAVNPSTGRRQRAAARRPVQYQESSEDEIQATDESREASPRTQRQHPVADSLIVKLRIPTDKMRRSTRVTRQGSSPEVPSAIARRSSRISHHSEDALVSLTDSGKHTQLAQPNSRAPSEQPQQRATRGSKGMKKPPSAIMEASHETSQQEFHQESFLSGLQSHAAEDEQADSEAEPNDGDGAGGDGSDAEDVQLETDIVPQSEAGEDVAAEAEHEEAKAEDDEDEDDEPILRKPSRSLRSQVKAPPPPSPAVRRSGRTRKATAAEPSSDFDPDAEDEAEDVGMSSDDETQGRKRQAETSDSANGARRSGRLAQGRGRNSQRQSGGSQSGGSEIDIDEIAELSLIHISEPTRPY